MNMIDLYCGRGGWSKGFQSQGYQCFGYDIDPRFQQNYPGVFRCRDVLELTAEELQQLQPVIICASSPCDEFSRHKMPWTRARHPPEPELGIRLARKAFSLAQQLRVPFIFENVGIAQRWLGPAVNHCGPFYFWGDVPALLPREVSRRIKESYGSRERDRRAEIPFELADWIARQNWMKEPAA